MSARASTLATLFLLMGAILAPIDYFVVNLALPQIGRDLSADGWQLQLIIAGYAGAYAIGLIPSGRLGDRFGRKATFLVGLTGFVLASVVCGIADNIYVLIAARFAQGIAASVLSPQVLATFRAVLPTRARTRAVAAYGFVFGLGSVVGQIGGGLLLQADVFGLGWRTIFLMNVPVGIIAIIGAARYVRENRSDADSGVDLPGVVGLCLLVGLLLAPLSLGSSLGWPWWSIWCLASTVPVAALLVRFESQRQRVRPILDIALIRRPIVWRVLVLALLFYTDSVFFMSLGVYSQKGLHSTVVGAALVFLPFSAGFIVGPLLMPWLFRSLDRYALSIGLATVSTGFAILSIYALSSVHNLIVLCIVLAVAGVGHGVSLSSLTRVMVSSVERRFAGLGSSLLICFMQIGSAVGVAGLGSVFYSVLGNQAAAASYDGAFGVTMGCLTATLLACLLLSLSLARRSRAVSRSKIGHYDSQKVGIPKGDLTWRT